MSFRTWRRRSSTVDAVWRLILSPVYARMHADRRGRARVGAVLVSGRASPALARRSDLLLPLDARLLVVLAATNLGQDAVLFDLLIEAAKGALEGLVLADFVLRLCSTPSDPPGPCWAEV